MMALNVMRLISKLRDQTGTQWRSENISSDAGVPGGLGEDVHPRILYSLHLFDRGPMYTM